MYARLKFVSALIVLVCMTVALLTGSASAISVEVAKKCNALTAKAFPPRVPGNPAAGTAKGTGQDMRAYFKKCVESGGKMDDQGEQGGK